MKNSNYSRPSLLHLEDRLTPASLDISGGALVFAGGPAADNVTQSVSGAVIALYDSVDVIDLSADAYVAGWRGSGTNVVTGPRTSVSSEFIDLGGNGDRFSLRGNDASLEIAHTAVVYISSNAPTNTGDLHAILGTVTVDPDGTSLWVSNTSTSSGDSNVIIDNAGIHNFAGAGNNVDVVFGSGVFNLVRVTGSNSASLAESFTLSGAPGPVQMYANAGDDSVTVTADTSGLIRMGGGGDTVVVSAGVTFAGDVYGDAGADTFDFNTAGFGTVTGDVVQ